jgi:hypothetical protein
MRIEIINLQHVASFCGIRHSKKEENTVDFGKKTPQEEIFLLVGTFLINRFVLRAWTPMHPLPRPLPSALRNVETLLIKLISFLLP